MLSPRAADGQNKRKQGTAPGHGYFNRAAAGRNKRKEGNKDEVSGSYLQTDTGRKSRSYNSNFDGFMQALEVLSKFNGNKIVVSPGVVELGKQQWQVNYDIGKEIGKVADFFVIMNQTNKNALFEGAQKGGMTKSNIFFADTRQQQKMILKKLLKAGDVVLFENDFPDNIK